MHAAMPCPHDGACPLLPHFRESCKFAQQYDPPAFQRETTKSYKGYHEWAEHSYVVLRRGLRPESPGTVIGRVGPVGREEEVRLHNKRMAKLMEQNQGEPGPVVASPAVTSSPEVGEQSVTTQAEVDELKATLRKEAVYWPRLIYPPLKKAGHVILDGCTEDGTMPSSLEH